MLFRSNKDISDYDIHVQFIQTYDGVEGDSASVSIATAVISAIDEIPIDQTVALTGSLNVRGDVMPIGGATAKIEAAAEAGMKKVLIPKSNLKDVMIEKKYEDNFLAAINEPVKEIMTRDLITLSNKSSIGQTIEVMLSNQLGAIPLVDADEKLAGIVTERAMSP